MATPVERPRARLVRGRPLRARRDWGRLFTRVLCAIFAVIGAVPLGVGGLVRTSAVRNWASRETAALLERELGVTASYRVHVDAWPFALALEKVAIDASDGKGPAFEAARIAVRPRVFSLLAGKLDAGDIEIDSPHARLVVHNGVPVNVHYHLPAAPQRSPTKIQHAPFVSIAVTDGQVDLNLDDLHLHGGDLDVDVSAQDGPSFDIALRAGQQLVRRDHELVTLDEKMKGQRAADEDVLCNLDARVHVDERGLLVRRLTANGAFDLDPEPTGAPGCALPANDPRRVELDLSQARVILHDGGPPELGGHVRVRAPVAMVNRFVPFPPLAGWVGADVEIRDAPGRTLPELRGTVTARGVELDCYRLASDLNAQVEIANDTIRLSRGTVAFGDGTVGITDLTVEPLKKGAPIHIGAVDALDVHFAGMMRDLGVTPHAHVGWTYKNGHITNTQGTLVPVKLDGEFVAQTSDFEVFDRAVDDPGRRHMIGVKEARAAGHVAVRPDAIIFGGVRVDFGSSHIETTVSLGFHSDIGLTVAKGSRVELGDVSPLAALKMGGRATLDAEMKGKFSNPELVGNLAVAGLSLDEFPLGDVASAKVRFVPLTVDFSEVHATKNKSAFDVPSARLDFNGPASMLADASIDASELDVRDFLHMWKFDTDPRFADLLGHGSAKATVHYDLGGPADQCGHGFLSVRGGVHLARAEIFDEPYDGIDSEFSYAWADRDAADLGLDVDIRTLVMKKGRGSIFGSGTVRRGGLIKGRLVADEVPVGRIRALGTGAKLVDGTASATVTLDGTIDELAADADIRVSALRVGAASLPASHAHVVLVPPHKEKKVIGHTHCGQPITPAFDRAEFDQDLPQGTFQASGAFFGGQVAFDDLKVTRQRNKTSSGTIAFTKLDLGALASGFSSAPAQDQRPTGSLSGTLNLEAFSTAAPERARAEAKITELDLHSASGRVALRNRAPPIVLSDDKLQLPAIDLGFSTPSGISGTLTASGDVKHLSGNPELDLALSVAPVDLAAIAPLIPRAERASGTLDANLTIKGKASAPLYNGEAHLKKGELALRGFDAAFSDVNLDLAIGGGELRIVKGGASVGGGTVTMTGHAPVHGLEVGDVDAVLTARGVHLPLQDHVDLTLDADLTASMPRRSGEDRELPRVSGDVTLTSFSYTRPIVLSADLGAIAQGGHRKTFEAYDPANDLVNFDIRLRSREPMRFRNNLVDAQLSVDSDALALVGTNQRYGARGQLRVLPAGRIRLRANEFEIKQGYVRFDDPTRIAPSVDLTAVTEYRRYSEVSAAGAGTSGAAASAAGGAGGARGPGGVWRITLHAYGEAENLRLEMTSEPALSQEDIVLLLTLGMTRAEIDSLQASSLGSTAALEALSALTGADSAVRKAVPVIDDFRFGNAYSSRTGRTEPTVTVGKRVTEQLRANVTSGLSDNREIRSNLELKLTPRVSVQGSYDNVNDVSSSSLGNLGADVRYRLEFE